MGREISYPAGGKGRDGSQGQGRGGQGSSKAPEMKYIPHGIGKEVWQPATYQTVKDYIIQWCRSHLEMEKMSQTP
jgi:hypothetical protein